MAAVLRQLANAIAGELNSAEFSRSFVAVRKYLPIYDRQDMQQLRVTVAPREQQIEPQNRARDRWDYQVDIGVQQHFVRDPEDLDPLVDLVEEICDHLRGREFDGVPAAWVQTQNTNVAAREHLETLQQFTSVITLSYRAVR